MAGWRVVDGWMYVCMYVRREIGEARSRPFRKGGKNNNTWHALLATGRVGWSSDGASFSFCVKRGLVDDAVGF